MNLISPLRVGLGEPVSVDALLVEQLVEAVVLGRPLADDVVPVVAHAVLLAEQRARGAEKGSWTILRVNGLLQTARRAIVEQLGTYRDGAELVVEKLKMNAQWGLYRRG